MPYGNEYTLIQSPFPSHNWQSPTNCSDPTIRRHLSIHILSTIPQPRIIPRIRRFPSSNTLAHKTQPAHQHHAHTHHEGGQIQQRYGDCWEGYETEGMLTKNMKIRTARANSRSPDRGLHTRYKISDGLYISTRASSFSSMRKRMSKREKESWDFSLSHLGQ